MSIKKLTEKRNDLRSQASAVLDKAKNEGRALTKEEKDAFDGYINQVAEIDSTIDAAEALDKIENKTYVQAGTDNSEDADVKNLAAYVRAKIQGIDVVNANLGTGDNGAIIPTSIANKIIQKVKEISPIYERATKYAVKGNVTIPRVDDSSDDVTVGYVEEFAAVQPHSFKFASITLSDYSFASLAKISKKIINSTDFDLVNFVINYMAEKLAMFVEHECIVGTESRSKGIVGSYDAENMSVTLASANAITADELIDIQELVPDAYRASCEWILNKSTRKAIRKLKDSDGDYVLQRDFTAPAGYTLLGNPVRLSDNMPKLGTGGSVVVIFGDYSGLAVKEAVPHEIQVLNERYADENAVGIKCYGEIDAQVENTQKFACGVTPSV